jgi:hypothetical protein
MGRVTKYKPLYPWLGGLNTSVDPTILDPNNLTVCDNIIFTTSGSRKKRGGQARFNSTAAAGATSANFVHLSDYWATVSSAQREYFVGVTDNGKVYRSAFNGTWSSFSTLTLSVTQGGVTSTVFNNDLFIGISGSGVPKVWQSQSTSSNLVALAPTGSTVLPFTNAWIVQTFLERLFVAGDPANPDKLYVSKTGTAYDWTATGAAGGGITFSVGVGDGDPSGITAIFPGTGADRILYIAKRRRMYRLDCSDVSQVNWKVSLISKEIGVISQNTVATIDDQDVIFASDRGVHTINQVLTTTDVVEGQFLSFPIQYDWLNVLTTSARQKMSAVYMPSLNSYLIGGQRTGQATYETIYGFNIELKQWYRWTGTPCNFLKRRFNKSTGVEELYAGDGSGKVNQLLQAALNDFGNPIPAQIRTTFIAPEGIPLQENQYTNVAAFYRAHDNSTIRCSYSVDGLTSQNTTFAQKIAGGNTLGTTLLGPAFLLGQIQSIKPVWSHLAIEEGNAIQFTFIQDGLNQDFEMFGIVLEYTADEESQNAFRNGLYS